MTDTIFALSSGALPAAIAVVRVSGPVAASVIDRMAGRRPAPRRASLLTLRDAAGDVLDRALVLWFPGPATATGEDLAELHLHGGTAVVAAVEAAIVAIPGCRRAQPGEFTRRALLNGRIDLTQAEGLADLLAAQSEAERRAALASADGHFSRDIARWLDDLLDAAALIETAIDHDEEAAVDRGEIDARLDALASALRVLLVRPTVEQLAGGYRIVLAGPPNAGKSSLFNLLVEREAAIVSDIAGTTRDRIEAQVRRAGALYTIIDTAGLATDTSDPIEREGIARSQAAMASADLVLWLGDAPPPPGALALNARCDLPGRETSQGRLNVSALDRVTIPPLWDAIAARCASTVPAGSYRLHDHQRVIMEECVAELHAALQQSDLILIAEHVRRASRMLSSLRGIDETEAVLDRVFSRFCLGK